MNILISMNSRDRSLRGSFYDATPNASATVGGYFGLWAPLSLPLRLLRGDGDCPFLIDPSAGADRAPVVWIPQLDPTAILVAPAPDFDARSLRLIVPDFQQRASDGEYWLIGRGARRAVNRVYLGDCRSRYCVSQTHRGVATVMAAFARQGSATRSSHSARARAKSADSPRRTSNSGGS